MRTPTPSLPIPAVTATRSPKRSKSEVLMARIGAMRLEEISAFATEIVSKREGHAALLCSLLELAIKSKHDHKNDASA